MGIILNHYLYGVDYDARSERFPGQGQGNIVIYQRIDPNQRRVMGSLEGFFVSSVDPNEIFVGVNDRSVIRKGMGEFAKNYGGIFIPFEDGFVRITESAIETARRVNNDSKDNK